MKNLKQLTLSLGIAMLFAACSDQGTTTRLNPITNDTAVEAPDYQSPPIDDLLESLPEGFTLLATSGPDMLDNRNCPVITVVRSVSSRAGINVSCGQNLRLIIEPNVAPYNFTLMMRMPAACLAIGDFFPHPLQFNRNVEIRWNLENAVLPPGYTREDIVPWYVNENGQLEPVTWTLAADQRSLSIWTNHFSRYILTVGG